MTRWHGRRVVITRPREQAGELAAAVAGRGAIPLFLPALMIAPPLDPAPLAAAVAEGDRFDGWIFTSANAVAAVAALQPAARASWICAIGPATAAALARLGWPVDILAAQANSEGVVDALRGRPLRGRRVLLPVAAQNRGVIAPALAALGAEVTVVEAYRSLPPPGNADAVFPASGPPPDAVLFTSAATARNLAALLGPDFRERLSGTTLIAMGEPTRAALSELGLRSDAVAEVPGAAGLLAALDRAWDEPHA